MVTPIRVLLQTTLLPVEDDWTIERFSLLRDFLRSWTAEDGTPQCEVTVRDRHPDAEGNDPVLSHLDRQEFDQLWLFALDVGDGLSPQDAAGILRFHRQGGGILTTRDHQDMGLSMAQMPDLGQFHHFHTQNRDPDDSRCCADDTFTPTIDFPNYHSGANGDYQMIHPVGVLHDLLKRPDGSPIEYFPAHPHEGSVGVPMSVETTARVIATGTSQVTHRDFNLVVVSDPSSAHPGTPAGRLVAQSTFHHFVDYNWDTRYGCPSFVEEPPGTGMVNHPQALQDVQTYVQNLVLWLMPVALTI